jgi:protein-export membrane protein SecD
MASKKRNLTWPIVSVIVAVYLAVVALPGNAKTWAPSFLQPTLHLGLDLQGGTQLDFRISESEMQKQISDLETQISELEAVNGDQATIDDKRSQISNIEYLSRNIVESIRTVIERRVNSMGVSEAVITPSYYGNEKHLLVECPGVVDIQRCIATVGKTIQLEFKEQFEGEDEEHIKTMRGLAENALRRISASGETLQTVGEDVGPTLGVFYNESHFYRDELPKGLEDMWNRSAGDAVVSREVQLDDIPRDDALIENRGMMMAEVSGDTVEQKRTFADPTRAIEYLADSDSSLRLIRHEAENPDNLDETTRITLGDAMKPGTLVKGKTKNGQTILLVSAYTAPIEEIEASHILIAYTGAVRADTSVTRTKEQAKAQAEKLRAELKKGANFAELARTQSDGPSAAKRGSLGRFGRGVMTPTFETAAFALKKNEISEIVETEFGFHIIRLDAEPNTTKGSISFLELVVSGEDAEALQESTFQAIKNRTVSRTEMQTPLRTLFFSFVPTGWKDTALDGKHFRRATVTTDPITGIPVVQIVFDDEGGRIFQELTKNNIGKPIAIFVGGELVSAPTVQGEIPGGVAIITGSRNFDEANRLAQDLNTGAIPAPIHLVGQVTVEASLGDEALKKSINAALLGFLLVGLYMIWYYRVLGFVATIALFAYAVIFTALLKLPLFLFTDQYVVLTLAGIAGMILSIGMAVDANVLIFERMKEELKKGKMLHTAADTGFKRAWSSIRDSNISTLLTAAILFIIGTSVVRGFAVTLSLGILISMFTAVVVTRFLIRLLYKSPISDNLEAFGVRKE